MEKPSTFATLAPVGRLAWLLFCPAVLFPITLTIVLKSRGWFTMVDLAFFVVLGLALLGRWLEFQGENPRTAYDEPASPAHLRRFLLIAPVAGIAIWIAANVLGNHVLTSWA